jgi:hypothetical protein
MTGTPHEKELERMNQAIREPGMGLRALAAGLALAVGMLFAGASAQGTAASSEVTFPNGIKGEVQVAPAKGFVGSQATLSGTGFEPGANLDIVWVAFDGAWKLEMKDGEYTGNFLGRSYTQRQVDLASVTADSSGAFSTTFTVPEGFGGNHDIYVRDNGDFVNKAGYFVRANWSMSPQSGPVGTNITIHATGLDQPNNIAGWDAVTYDNNVTGVITAQTTHGTANIVIPATGSVGKHFVAVQDAAFGQPYLAIKSSPYGYLNLPEFTFTVTDGAPVLPAPIGQQDPKPTPGVEPTAAGPKLWVDPSGAGVFTKAQIHGRDLPANAEVKLAYTQMSGSRVTTAGYQAMTVPVATVTTDANGAFDAPFKIPDALGGAHRLEASIGDKVVAKTYFNVEAVGLALEPSEGPVGTKITLHMKGIGWTQTNNIFGIVIDNTYIGYACGFSTNGDVVVPITAAWAPGWHFIDLYPSFYRNKNYSAVDEQPFFFRQAVLTWQDHPHKIHFRFAFHVTGN